MQQGGALSWAEVGPPHVTPLAANGARSSVAAKPIWLLTWLLVLVFASVLLLYAALQRGAELFGEIKAGEFVVTRGALGVVALEKRARDWAHERVTLHVGPYIARLRREELGAQLPVAGVRDRLLTLGSTGNPFEDLAALLASHADSLELPLRPVIDRAALSARIQEVRKKLERPPISGMVLADGRSLPGIPGISINSVTATQNIEQQLLRGATDLELATTRIEPPGSRTYRGQASGSFGEIMKFVETAYRSGGGSAGRAHNIELAANAIDGTVLPPGGELSFNQSVGERSYARGFATAKELANKRVVDGVGGGVCQVAATLHAAAFLTGLSLPEYRPHSRPAGYIDLGLDTMVSWPNQDMRIANSYPFPIRIRARANDGVLAVWLEGAGKAHPVEWDAQILSRVKPGVQEVPDPELAAGEREVVQEAIDGLHVRRTRTIYLPTGPRVEENMLRYPPNDRIIAVGRGGRGAGHSSSLRSSLDSDQF
jgi:vancomycin resistance protein YoaR